MTQFRLLLVLVLVVCGGAARRRFRRVDELLVVFPRHTHRHTDTLAHGQIHTQTHTVVQLKMNK